MEVISFSLVGLVLVVSSLLGWRDYLAYVDYRSQATHSRQVVASIEAVLDSVIDAETAQRGYLLTNRANHRKAYDRAVAALPAEIARLRELTWNDRSEADEVEKLIGSLDRKTGELKETIRLRRTAGFQAALDLVETGIGESTMQDIRTTGKALVAQESQRLVRLTGLAQTRNTRSWAISATGDVLLGVMLALASAAILRSSRRRESLIASLRERDVNLRQSREQAEAAEERVRNILESIADGFISFDRDWAITYLNAEAERIFGRSKSELLGKNFWLEFPDRAGSVFERNLREAAAGRLPVSFETYFQDRDSWWEQNVYPGKDGALSVYFRDVSDRKRLEDRARHAHKLESLGVLAGGIAHDFNNLLTAIIGSASLALEQAPGDSPAVSSMSNVLAASERAAQLTRQMLAYSGRGRFVVEPFDISAQVREITALLHASLGGNIELVLNLQDGAIIEGDGGQFQSVVMNLVINAAEAVGEKAGTVAISTSLHHLDAEYLLDNMSGDDLAPGPYVLLEVHDTGQGMDQATQARIFDPFFTTKFTGRGLGLSAVLGIVRGHKGAIKVYSHPGQGTTLKLYFPAAGAAASLPPPPLLPAASFSGDATILVVDDEEIVLKMARSALQKYGYHVLEAVNGREALNIFKKQNGDIALVLLDMTMPVMSGEETLRELRSISPDVRVIVSSGYNEIEALRRFGRSVAGFLQKPYRAAVLAEKVKLGLQGSLPLAGK